MPASEKRLVWPACRRWAFSEPPRVLSGCAIFSSSFEDAVHRGGSRQCTSGCAPFDSANDVPAHWHRRPGARLHAEQTNHAHEATHNAASLDAAQSDACVATPECEPTMLGFLPPVARGAIAVLLLVINTIFWCSLLFAFSLLKLLLPFEAVRIKIDPILNTIATCWIACNGGWMRLTQRPAWDV